MPSERVVLISDVHLDEWEDDLPTQWQQKRQAFLAFLEHVAAAGKEGRVARFVIAGDLVDVPQRNRAALLPTYSCVYDRLQQIVAAGVRLGYVIGNHDAGLVGLSVDEPLICVGHPYILVKSGDTEFVVEHGHLYDPWLWDYVRQLASAMWTDSAGPSGVHVLAMAGGGEARLPAPAAAEAPLKVDELWQARLADAPLSEQQTQVLVEALMADLDDDYTDVTDPDADVAMLSTRRQLRAQLAGAPAGAPFSLAAAAPAAGAPLLEQLVQACYSGPHWRRAARTRLPKLAEDLKRPLAGIVMGHTHYADEDRWTGESGEPYWYVNAGSWRHDDADVLIIEGEHRNLVRRKWTEPLPCLL